MKKIYEFSLGGIDICVYDNRDINKIRKGAVGMSTYQQQRIDIDLSHEAKDVLEHTFYHELVHWITYVMGRGDLCNDEAFVDLFGLLLFQSMKPKVRFIK